MAQQVLTPIILTSDMDSYNQEKHKTLPNSRFRRVQYHSCRELFWKSVWIIACIIAFAIAFEPSFLRIDSFYKWLDFGEWNVLADLLALLFLLGTLAYVAAYLVRLYFCKERKEGWQGVYETIYEGWCVMMIKGSW